MWWLVWFRKLQLVVVLGVDVIDILFWREFFPFTVVCAHAIWLLIHFGVTMFYGWTVSYVGSAVPVLVLLASNLVYIIPHRESKGIVY